MEGLGVKNLRRFNIALLVKWTWRLESEDRDLWADIVKSKHGIWRSLNEGKEIGMNHYG